MKVAILGAAGRVGRTVTRMLFSLGGIEKVFLADRDAEALTGQSADYGRLPVSPRYLDAENGRSLRERLAEADLVLGCLGPFHRYEARVVEAAIDARRDYISLCDDPGATAEVATLHPEAVSRGVRILVGCGMTPGLSNLLACRAAARIRRPFSLQLDWYLEMGPGLGDATLEHLLRANAGKVDTLAGGKRAKARAGSREEVVEFPPPVGARMVGFMGHPEPCTLPGALPGAREIRFMGTVGDRLQNLGIQTLGWMGEKERMELWTMALRFAAASLAHRGKTSCTSALRVKAVGESEGPDPAMESVFAVCGDYYRISASAMLAAAAYLLAGKGWRAGIWAPEMVLDDPAYFSLLRGQGLRIMVGEGREEGARSLPSAT